MYLKLVYTYFSYIYHIICLTWYFVKCGSSKCLRINNHQLNNLNWFCSGAFSSDGYCQELGFADIRSSCWPQPYRKASKVSCSDNCCTSSQWNHVAEFASSVDSECLSISFSIDNLKYYISSLTSRQGEIVSSVYNTKEGVFGSDYVSRDSLEQISFIIRSKKNNKKVRIQIPSKTSTIIIVTKSSLCSFRSSENNPSPTSNLFLIWSWS